MNNGDAFTIVGLVTDNILLRTSMLLPLFKYIQLLVPLIEAKSKLMLLCQIFHREEEALYIPTLPEVYLKPEIILLYT